MGLAAITIAALTLGGGVGFMVGYALGTKDTAKRLPLTWFCGVCTELNRTRPGSALVCSRCGAIQTLQTVAYP